MHLKGVKMSRNKIAIVDFGGQYVRLIAKKIRGLGVYCEIVSPEKETDYFRSSSVQGIILSGGPASVSEESAPRPVREIFQMEKPVLGICYGMQLIADIFPGGRVADESFSEYGRSELELLAASPLLDDITGEGEASDDLQVWMSHGDSVLEAPRDFTVLARTEDVPVAAMAREDRQIYGVQFHPEVSHTSRGEKLLASFVFQICGMKANWQTDDIVAERIEKIQGQLGPEEEVLIGLSGGVDSTVTAALLEQALGDRVTGIFIDHGLLREGEFEEVKGQFSEIFDFPIYCLDASRRFLSRLKGVVDPEEKRNIIGEEFISVFELKARELEDVSYLAQGTIYSDVIESGLDQNAAMIKSHHNVGGLPQRMELDLLEPLRELFKDEVRKIGLELGLPQEFIWRQPFPGPGLAIRIIGELTEEKLAILRRADRILQEELEGLDSKQEIWQAFAVLPDMKTVGVEGDSRTYGYPVVIRAVDSEEAMTADWIRLPYDVLDRIAGRIVSEVEEVSRVVYDISSKPPATIEWE